MSCPTIVNSTICVEANVKIDADVEVGEVETRCIGRPFVQRCCNKDHKCVYMVCQRMRVRFPLIYCANVSAKSAGVACENIDTCSDSTDGCHNECHDGCHNGYHDGGYGGNHDGCQDPRGDFGYQVNDCQDCMNGDNDDWNSYSTCMNSSVNSYDVKINSCDDPATVNKDSVIDHSIPVNATEDPVNACNTSIKTNDTPVNACETPTKANDIPANAYKTSIYEKPAADGENQVKSCEHPKIQRGRRCNRCGKNNCPLSILIGLLCRGNFFCF